FHRLERERLAFADEGLCHLVFSFVAVRNEVADVSDIHYLLHVIAVSLKEPAHRISENSSAEIADMDIIVNSRAAVVHAYLRLAENAQKRPMERLKKLFFARER